MKMIIKMNMNVNCIVIISFVDFFNLAHCVKINLHGSFIEEIEVQSCANAPFGLMTLVRNLVSVH